MQSKSRLRPERLWLLLGVIWVIAFTLAPFTFSFVPNELGSRIKEALEAETDLIKDGGHVVSFLIIGILIAANLTRSSRGWISRLAVIVIACIALETAQLFQLGRHARLTDLILNIAGVIAGLAVGLRTAVGVRLCKALSTSAIARRIAPLIVVTGAVLVWWFAGLQPMFGGLTMDWDRTFPLMLANEIGGARQWSGQLRYAGIFGHALSPRQVRELYNNLEQPSCSDWRKDHHLLVGYDFRTGATERLKAEGELSDDSLALKLPANLRWSAGDGVMISAPAIFQTNGSVDRLTRQIGSLQAFTVEAWARPENLVQSGPARLVSSSSGRAFRNFTLGQAGENLVFRTRNQVNGLNGTNYELIAQSVIRTSWQHYIGAYDHGISSVYVDGARRATVDLREPTVYLGLVPGEFARIAFVVLAVITISLPATFVFDAMFKFRKACLAAVAVTLLAGSLPYLISCSALDAPWPLAFVVALLVALVVVYPVSLLYVSKSPTFSP